MAEKNTKKAEVNEDAMRLGSKGGVARARKLPQEQRAAIARKAALARWGQKPSMAIHRGNFKESFGFDVDCYVLDDHEKTAVISQRGMARALGFGSNATGTKIQKLVARLSAASLLGPDIVDRFTNPLVFMGPAPGPTTPPFVIHGYDVTLLIDLCNAIIEAGRRGNFWKHQDDIIKPAQIIVAASAKTGIKNLAWAVAGYNPTRDEVVAAFKMYVREEARKYEPEFPEELYQEWYRLYNLQEPARNRPWKFKQLTVDHVYKPLAQSNGRVLELVRIQRAKKDERHKKLHQFLSMIGVKALRRHLGQLLGMAQVSSSRATYERYVEKVFGVQLSLELEPEPEPEPAQ